MEEIALEHAGDDLERLGAAGADQAEHAGDLAGEHRQRIVLHHRRHLQVLHREHPRAGRPHAASCARRRACWRGRARPSPARSRARSNLAASSVTTCLPSRRTVMRSASSSASSSACEMKTIETPRCLRSRTRSKKYFFSSGVSVAVGSSKMMTLALVQDRARDLDHLLLGGAEPADGRGRRDVEIERLQELLRGDVDAAQPVVELLLPEKQVLRDRHGRHQAVLLEHHGDAEIARLQRRLRRDIDAVDHHGARGQRHHAGHHLGQRRLAGAVLADQRMDLAAAEVEVDVLDGRHAGIELCRLAQRE